jgi:hypothetical protein
MADHDAQLRVDIPVDKHAETRVFKPGFALGFVVVDAQLLLRPTLMGYQQQ